MPALKKIIKPEVELLSGVQCVEREILRAEKRNVLRIEIDVRVRPQVGGDFLSLILLNERALCQERVVVGERELNGLIKIDAGLRPSPRHKRERKHNDQTNGECPVGFRHSTP